MAKQVKKYVSKKAVKSAKPVAKKAPAKKVAPVCNCAPACDCAPVSTKPAKKSIFAKIKSIFGF